MLEIPITDDEILYRRILDGLDLYEVQADGTVLFNSQAFADRSWRPSVDRAKLCNNNPKHTLGSFSGGVTSLVTRDVRSINDIVQYDKNQIPIQVFKVDVEYVQSWMILSTLVILRMLKYIQVLPVRIGKFLKDFAKN